MSNKIHFFAKVLTFISFLRVHTFIFVENSLYSYVVLIKPEMNSELDYFELQAKL